MSTLATGAEERAALIEMARDLARRELAPRAADLDRGDPAALAECWQGVVGVGLHRALLGEAYGGVELGAHDLLAALEELAVGDGGIAMCALLCNAALATLDEALLAEIPEGARWVLVPPGGRPLAGEAHAARGDAASAARSNGRLDGRLPFVLGAHGADGLVLPLGEPAATWALGADTPGLKIERDPAQMGLRAAAAASVELAGVPAHRDDTPASLPGLAVSASNGAAAGAAMTLADASALLRAGTAAIATGIARRAYELALDYAQERRQGGVAIIEHDAVADMLSAMAVRLACRTPLAEGPHDPDDPYAPIAPARALAAKVSASDAAVATTTDAVQVFGGTGYMVETGVEKLMRDAKYCQLFPEPNWVAQDELLGR